MKIYRTQPEHQLSNSFMPARYLLLALFILTSSGLHAQGGKIRIEKKRPLATEEGRPITLSLDDFKIKGPGEDEYPKDFRLEVFEGEDYSVSNTTVTPDAGFNGKLKVSIRIRRVKNGRVIAESERTRVDVDVKRNAPRGKLKITGQKKLTTEGTTPITLQLTDFSIEGPGEKDYPRDFVLLVFDGKDYTVSGNTVTAADGFKGTLKVEIQIQRMRGDRVTEESDKKKIDIEVTAPSTPTPPPPPPVKNTPPQIIAQKSISVEVNKSVTIVFAHLTVVDPDNDYPKGFSIKLSDGPNYSLSGNNVVPDKDFVGILSVPVIVNDGKDNSDVFQLQISVVRSGSQPEPTPGGPPLFVTFGEDVLHYSVGNTGLPIATEIEIDDPDSKELFYAEVFFDGSTFLAGRDQLSTWSEGALSTVFDADAGILVIFGRASLAAYQQALRSVRYAYANDTLPAQRQRVIHFRLNDGENFSETKSKRVEIAESLVLDIPTVFSPNNDLSNDVWLVRPTRDADNVSVAIRVFDRRGAVVFETSQLEHYWDGRRNGSDVPADTYFYVIEIMSGANNTRYQGVVTVLR